MFLIPSMIIFGYLWGIKGVLYSGPFADGLAFLIAFILLVVEVKNLKNTKTKSQTVENNKNANRNSDKHIVITIGKNRPSRLVDFFQKMVYYEIDD